MLSVAAAFIYFALVASVSVMILLIAARDVGGDSVFVVVLIVRVLVLCLIILFLVLAVMISMAINFSR